MGGLVLFSLIVSMVIGALIDGGRGALLGVFGPFGWVVSVILKKKDTSDKKLLVAVRDIGRIIDNADTSSQSTPVSINKNAEISKRWEVLKSVDTEIRMASIEVAKSDPRLEYVLAEKFLLLNDKSYLQSLVEVVLRDYRSNIEHLDNILATRNDENSVKNTLLEPGVYDILGRFKLRVTPEKTVVLISDLSGTLDEYIMYDNIDAFCRANFVLPSDFRRLK